MALKHVREIIRRVASECPDALFSTLSHKGHIHLTVTLGKKSKRFTVSSSPKKPDHCTNNAIREISKHFELEIPIK